MPYFLYCSTVMVVLLGGPAPAEPAIESPAELDKPPAESVANDDPVRTRLEEAKATLDAETDAWRAAIAEWFDSREKRARKDGDKKAVDEIKAQRQAFADTGELPRNAPSSAQRRLAKAREAMAEAYANAVAEYTKLSRDDDAAAVAEEARAFAEATKRDAPRDDVPVAPDSKILRARAKLAARLAGSRWEWGGGFITFNPDGTAHATGRPDDPGVDLTWTAISGDRAVVRWPSDDFDIFTFSADGRHYTKDWLGRPTGQSQNIVRGERVK